MRDKDAEKIAGKLIKRISAAREAKDLSYDGLAMLAGLNKSTIGLTENRKSMPTILTLIKMCRALDIKLSDIAKDSRF